MQTGKSLLLAQMLWLLAVPLYAHTELTETQPADGAVLNIAPAALELDFSAPVQLVKLKIVDDGKAAVATGFKASAAAQSVFSIKLPKLKPATYNASWTVVGKDGHRVEGKLAFTVDPLAIESPGKPAARGHHDKH